MSLLDAFLLDPVRVNVWIADRRKSATVSDGGLGAGTQNDPWDGSGGRLDALLESLPINTCVHLGPGEFQTSLWQGTPVPNTAHRLPRRGIPPGSLH